MPYLRIFGLKFLKTIVIFEISTLKFVKLQNFPKKQKCLNLGPKMPYWVFLGYNFKKLLSYLKSATSNLSNCKISRKKQNCLNLGPKMPYWVFLIKIALFGCFRARIFLKNYCHIWNQHPQICIFAKFCEKTKMPKFGTKNALFGFF